MTNSFSQYTNVSLDFGNYYMIKLETAVVFKCHENEEIDIHKLLCPRISEMQKTPDLVLVVVI